MSARELVGRALVPFFDAEDNVNEALRVDLTTRAQERLDVDARVWDRELGYFVYPNEDASASSSSGHAHSQPIAIQKTSSHASNAAATADAAGSFGKLLLTPDMLSRSAPSNHSSGMEQMQMQHNHTAASSANNSRAATPRSASAKRSSRQKTRSSTPNKSRNKQQQQSTPATQTQSQPSTNDSGSSGSGGEDRTNGSDSSEKSKNNKKNNKNGESRKSRNKQQQQPPAKAKDEQLSGNGKWAWSAFQSSPDPKSLPLPPFVAGGGVSPGVGALPPPLDPPKIEERLDPPPPGRLDRPPSVPPENAPPPVASIEHSMTQDLRRMLNIGS